MRSAPLLRMHARRRARREKALRAFSRYGSFQKGVQDFQGGPNEPEFEGEAVGPGQVASMPHPAAGAGFASSPQERSSSPDKNMATAVNQKATSAVLKTFAVSPSAIAPTP